MIALNIDLREDDLCMCVWLCFYYVCILQSVSRVAHVNDCVEDRSEKIDLTLWHVCVA